MDDDEDCDGKLHVRKDMIVVGSVSRSRLFCWVNIEILWEQKMMKEQSPGEALVELECRKWMKYETRNNRSAYKEGAGLQKYYVHDCIFDADFQPEKDFLTRTVPYLLYNPVLGLVQARWKFVNADECLMTAYKRCHWTIISASSKKWGLRLAHFSGLMLLREYGVFDLAYVDGNLCSL